MLQWHFITDKLIRAKRKRLHRLIFSANNGHYEKFSIDCPPRFNARYRLKCISLFVETSDVDWISATPINSSIAWTNSLPPDWLCTQRRRRCEFVLQYPKMCYCECAYTGAHKKRIILLFCSNATSRTGLPLSIVDLFINHDASVPHKYRRWVRVRSESKCLNDAHFFHAVIFWTIALFKMLEKMFLLCKNASVRGKNIAIPNLTPIEIPELPNRMTSNLQTLDFGVSACFKHGNRIR